MKSVRSDLNGGNICGQIAGVALFEHEATHADRPQSRPDPGVHGRRIGACRSRGQRGRAPAGDLPHRLKWREEQFSDNENTQRPIVDHLPKVDAATQQMRRRYWEDVLRQLDGLPRNELSASEQLNYDVYRPQIEVLIANQRFRE